MAALLPELDAEDQRCILGGTATTTIPPGYTGTVPEPATTVPTTVDPYAVTGSMPTATTSMPTTTVPTGVVDVSTGVYTWEDMERMLDDGSWYGGKVEGIGYVGEQSTAFSPSNFGTGTYCSFSEYMRSIETNYGDHLVNTATGMVPLFGTISEYGIGAINNVRQKLSGDLLDAGYSADSVIYTDIYQNFEDKTYEFRVWDARTGKLISSRDVNSMGYYDK